MTPSGGAGCITAARTARHEHARNHRRSHSDPRCLGVAPGRECEASAVEAQPAEVRRHDNTHGQQPESSKVLGPEQRRHCREGEEPSNDLRRDAGGYMGERPC